MSLYLKYRPSALTQVRGNYEVISALEGMLSNKDTCPHSFLLHGPTGCGKTTIGRIIANRLGCVGEDFKEVDSADFRGIDTVREIRKNSAFMAIEGSCRVWLIDECHKMTNDAQNALLKILEDTPSHVYFILCTTEPQKLIPTIRGRCSQFQVSLLDDNLMSKLIKKISGLEGISLDESIINQIVKSSKGYPRNALQILDQVIAVPTENRMEAARKAELELIQSIELCRALIKRASWSEIAKILTGIKDQEAETIRRAVLGYCQATLLNNDNTIAGLIMSEFVSPFYDSGFPQLVFACYSINKTKI